MIRIGAGARAVGTAAIIAGVVMLSYAGVVVLRARAYQHAYDAAAQAAATGPAVPVDVRPAAATPLTPRPLVEGATIGEIRVDRIGLRTVITQGESDAILALGAGHLADTPWLGESGNVVLAGHRDTVFRPLEHIRTGDLIQVTADASTTRYVVTSTKIVEPTDLSVLDASDGNTLTLITCFPFVYVGHAPHRFIVRATEVR